MKNLKSENFSHTKRKENNMPNEDIGRAHVDDDVAKFTQMLLPFERRIS